MKRTHNDVAAASPSTSGEGIGTRTRRSGRFGMGGSTTAPLTVNVTVKSERQPVAGGSAETNEQRMTRKLTRSQCPSGPPSATPSLTDDNDGKASSKRSSKISKGSRKSGVTGQTVELFRTDYITAMKMNDNDAGATADNMLVIDDSWRQEWNRGVQVPVNNVVKTKPEWHALSSSGRVNVPAVTATPEKNSSGFKLPHKYVCLSKTGNLSSNLYYRADWHKVVHTAKQAEGVCPYDMDDMDTQWLSAFNKHRKTRGTAPVSAQDFERVIECLENQCAENIDQAIVAPGNTNAGREFDDDSVCDVCMSPNQEEDDAIVFCDGCDLCVHQSCYGVAELPSGPWLCRVCALVGGRLPPCELCPNRGGAMKCTQSGERWAHISCVLWIPEVRFGDPELLEPVMHLRSVPEDRWLLRCSLCDKREGACIQCDVKTCRMSYHVTCAQRKSLEMRSETKPNGELQLLSYCSRHSRRGPNSGGLFDHSDGTPQKSQSTSNKKSPRSARSSTPPAQQQTLLDSPRKRKARRVQTMYARFYQYVSLGTCSAKLELDEAAVVTPVFEYWKLKRRRNNNSPLLTSREDEAEMLERQEEEALIRRVRTLIAMRQNLEKARNLCYMIERREKVKKSYVDLMGVTCAHMAPIVDDDKCLLSRREAAALTSNYLRPLAGFDECIFPRVTDEHVEDEVERWISETGGRKRTEPPPPPMASSSSSGGSRGSTSPKTEARSRRSSSRQATAAAQNTVHMASLELLSTPERRNVTPSKADAFKQADQFWLKQSEAHERDNNHNRIGMLNMNGTLHYNDEDEDVNVVDGGDSSSVASDDSVVHSTVQSGRFRHSHGGFKTAAADALGWYKQNSTSAPPAHVTAAHRLITAQQHRRRQMAMAANDRLRSPPGTRTTIVRAVGHAYNLDRSAPVGATATLSLQRSPPSLPTTSVSASSERVRRRYPIVTTRRGYYPAAHAGTTAPLTSPQNTSSVSQVLSPRSSATPRLMATSAAAASTSSAVTHSPSRFTISMRAHDTQPHSHSVLKRVAAPHAWASEAKRSRLSPSVTQLATRRATGSLGSTVATRTPIVILNASGDAIDHRRSTRSNAFNSNSDPFEFDG